ncbi:Rne/Rng family ribonuclease [Hyphococcus sp. DH-69]|uniref:Rne/Rng family ribonuclease n=1 Tax=Hyphococcus formosus TaxID=3143534 RepID=UPI00398B322E
MTKKMLIDAAHPEEVRVAVLDNGKVEDFDFESESRKPLRGNIYLARVTRVEPSLQAAFVEYGGNRHGFLAFSEIHPDYYQIPVSDRLALQEAEAEVVELAAQLELTQRGDDDDDQDDEKPKKKARSASDDEEADDDDLSSDDGDESDSDDDPTDEIAEPDRDEEEEEEQDGEEDQDGKVKAAKEETSEDTLELTKEDQVPSDESASDENTEGSTEVTAQETENVSEEHSDDGEASEVSANETVEAADDEEVSNDDADEAEESDEAEQDDASGQNGESRQALFERYKEAKRKRANLLRNYKIQEVIKRRQILLIQVVKEERGNKGAALTTYMSLAGRYCVLMPNTARGGGISRKIPHSTDRRRLRRVVDSLDVPQGMGLIIRTAGAKRTKIEIKRDYDYLLRLWENIRTLTLKSIAPCLIYEEASLIKRAIRDLYDKDISEVLVEGEAGYREAKDFMKMLMPSHAKFVQPFKDKAPLFLKHGVEAQLDGMYQPTVRLKSGGYIVINQTEALIAIDVNSGRATRERNIEQTALKTNIEAAYEAARQFRLRDLAGLVVLDFIDMEEPKNNRKVEKALKDAVKHDRARIQLGRISNFGLLEMSRQRRRSGIIDGTTQSCPTCAGAGVIRSAEMAALRILRALEAEAISGKAGILSAHASLDVTVYVLNNHRDWLKRIEDHYGVTVQMIPNTDRAGDDYDIEKSGTPRERSEVAQVIQADQTDMIEAVEDPTHEASESEEKDGERKKRRRRRRRKDKDTSAQASDSQSSDADATSETTDASDDSDEQQSKDGEEEQGRRRRRRGRRGGRRNRRGRNNENTSESNDETGVAASSDDSAESAQAESAQADDSADKKSDDQPAEEPKTTAKEAEVEVAAEPEVKTNGAHPPQNGANGHDGNQDTVEQKEADPQTQDSPEESASNSTENEKPKPKKRGWWRRGSDA